MYRMPRRTLLRSAAGSTLALCLGPVLGGRAWAATPADFAQLRNNWGEIYIGTGINPGNPAFAGALSTLQADVDRYVSLLNTDMQRQSVFTDLAFGSDSKALTATFLRLQTMASGYAVPGNFYHGNTTLRDQVIAGLDFMVQGPYSPNLTASGTPYGNWYDWQMGSTRPFSTTAMLVYDALIPSQIDAYSASLERYKAPINTTGANQTAGCQVWFLHGILTDNATKISTAVNALSAGIKMVTSGDGFYADGGFIQHSSFAYTGLYGIALIGEIMPFVKLLSTSPWPIKTTDLAMLGWAVESMLAPWVYNGLMLDAVRGRQIAYYDHPDVYYGNGSAVAALRMADASLDPALAARLRARAKGWLQRAPIPLDQIGTLPGARLGDLAAAQAALTDANVVPTMEPTGHSYMASVNRAVHRRPGWAAALAMSSNRISRYESINSENLHGWHTGMGMLNVQLDSDATQYNDQFWPTVDPYAIPGTTICTKTLADGTGSGAKPNVAWAGGVTDGRYAIMSQDVTGPGSTLAGKKTWIFLDDTIICMGAGLVAPGETSPVVTTIDNRNLGETGGNELVINGSTKVATAGSSTVVSGAKWAWLNGHNGYVFPAGSQVSASRENRAGSWRDIHKGGSGATAAPSTIYNRQYVKLQINHGVAPNNASYCYFVMPGASKSAVIAKSNIQPTVGPGWMTILANTASQQGVAITSLGLIAINFFAAGTVGAVAATTPLSVMIRENGDGTATIVFADPTRSVTAGTFTWARKISAVLAAPSGVTVTPGDTLRVDHAGLNTKAGVPQSLLVQLG